MNLDFDNYIKVEHGYLLFPFPDEKYKVFNDIYDRICAVIYMSSNIGTKPDKHGVSKEATTAAFIRAALSELVALEEYVQKEYPDIDSSIYKIYKTSDPILHMIKLLRNYNIHVSSSILSQKSMTVRTLVENAPDFEIEVQYISNLSFESVRSLRSSSYYADWQLLNMIELFDDQQHEFGVSTLIIKAALSYIELFEPTIDKLAAK